MNKIELLQADLMGRLPGITAEIDPPEIESGDWYLNVKRGDDYLVLIEWRPSRGFGVSTPKPDDLWSGPDEIYRDATEAFARIVGLIENGGETVSP